MSSLQLAIFLSKSIDRRFFWEMTLLLIVYAFIPNNGLLITRIKSYIGTKSNTFSEIPTLSYKS